MIPSAENVADLLGARCSGSVISGPIGRRLAEAGIALTVLPATDLFLTGRDSTHLVPRGVTPAHRLAALGVVTTISTNNVLNPFGSSNHVWN